MDITDEKAKLLRYLRTAREAMLWKLDGVSEYDVRRPVTPTGTNLLGLVKHLSMVEFGYLGAVFGRPFPGEALWDIEDTGDNEDMFATAEQSRSAVVDFYERVARHSDETIETLSLDAVGHVPWWPEDVNDVSLHHIIVHMIAETNRHAGHADIVRETIDGEAGLRDGGRNLPDFDAAAWKDYVALVESEAVKAAE